MKRAGFGNNFPPYDVWAGLNQGVGVWDDLKFPFTQTKINPVNDKPDFDFTNVGYLFPQNDATEKIYFIGQFPHSYMLGTNIRPHIHWQQSAATAVTWKLDYKWFNNGDAVPAAFTTISASSGVYTYTSGNLAQISSFAEIDGSGITGHSSMFLGIFYRDDNTTTGDVLGWEFDIHFLKTSMGTDQEFSNLRS